MAWLSLGRAPSPGEACWLGSNSQSQAARGLTAAFAQLLQPSCRWHRAKLRLTDYPSLDAHWTTLRA